MREEILTVANDGRPGGEDVGVGHPEDADLVLRALWERVRQERREVPAGRVTPAVRRPRFRRD